MEEDSLGICAVILAAGESKRFGVENKLVAKVNGVPMLERVVRVITASGVKKTLVVTGSDSKVVSSLLSNYEVEFVYNESWQKGMGTSLAVAALKVDDQAYAGLLICLGDLPFLELNVMEQLLEAFRESRGRRITIPCKAGKLGHPVIFPISFIEKLQQLSGDEGARAIIRSTKDSLDLVDVESSGIFRDIDTMDDL